ncbi:MAG: 2-oxo acid dehydrogenase subunit E2 [Anaerolineales bacterium]|nr:2-oxo acid dehydrogenase subunit E2 [Anaerolineales bacterium]
MPTVVAMPKLGFDMAEGLLVRWVKREGEAVEKGEILAEIETDKATVEVEATTGGVLRGLLVAEKTSVPVGTPIAVIGTADEPIDLAALLAEAGAAAAPPPAAAAPPPAGQMPIPPTPAAWAAAKASPLARRMAAERGLPLASLAGSGPGGRITKRDVEAAAAGTTRRQDAPGRTPAAALQTERVALTKLRSAVGRRMQTSKQLAPHFYLTSDLDAGPLMDLRVEFNALLPEPEKLSINDFIVKAAALALREFPALNASLEGESILRHGEIHIGLAVATDNGLLTVVARDADRRPLAELAESIRQIVARARQGRVRPEDIEGATFTISNLGMYEIEHFAAIINPPEAAILAVGAVRQVPVVHEGAVIPGWRMKVTLSADHRVTDGAEGARFMQALRQRIEHPLQLVV